MYQVHGTGDSRLLTVPRLQVHRWKFVQIVDGEKIAVKFQHAGSKLLAVVSGTVLVYKKPHPSVYGGEVLKSNRLKYWSGSNAPLDYDRILDNMMEYVEAI